MYSALIENGTAGVDAISVEALLAYVHTQFPPQLDIQGLFLLRHCLWRLKMMYMYTNIDMMDFRQAPLFLVAPACIVAENAGGVMVYLDDANDIDRVSA